MSPGNVERIINKYAEKIRPEHPELPAKVHPHMLRRTRATNLYQSDVELELVSRNSRTCIHSDYQDLCQTVLRDDKICHGSQQSRVKRRTTTLAR